jgi:hypothetical protein
MIRIFTAFLIMCCSFLTSFGQPADLILAKAQNDQWFDSLATLPLPSQLKMIKQRLLADTNVFVRETHPDAGWVRWKDSLGNRVYGDVRPLLVAENVFIGIGKRVDRKKIVALTELLDTNTIQSLTFLKGNEPTTMAIYGSKGTSGVILLKLRRKSDAKIIRELELNY